jgi:hypothetical protein
MKFFLKILLPFLSFCIVGCGGFAFNPKSPRDLQEPEYLRISTSENKSIEEIRMSMQEYKMQCPSASFPPYTLTIERSGINTGFTIIAHNNDTVLVARYEETRGASDVRIWAVSERLAKYFLYIIQGNSACVDSIWDKRFQ